MAVKVRKRRGAWWIVVDHKGQRFSKKVGDRKAADAVASAVRERLARGDMGLPTPPSTTDQTAPEVPTLSTFAVRYLKDAEHGLKRSTWTDYRSALDRHILPAFGDRLLTDIRRADVKRFALDLRTAGKSPKTAKKVVGVLSAVFGAVLDDEDLNRFVSANPCVSLKRFWQSDGFTNETTPTQIDPFGRDEVEHVLTIARTHTITRAGKVVQPYQSAYPFLLLLARTGLRLGEALALVWGDIDWRQRTIRVQRARVRGRITTPKNHKVRDVELSDQVADVLREMFADRYERVTAIDVEGQRALDEARAGALTDLIFTDRNGGPIDPDNFRHRAWEPLLYLAKMRKRRLHDLRHTYASTLINDGVPIPWVSAQLGHHSPAFTMKVYVRWIPAEHRRFSNRLDGPKPAEPTTDEGANPQPIRNHG